MKNIRDVEVDTLDLPCPKLGCLHVLRCNPCCQAWLFEVVIWHAAHALARDKSVLSSWGKNQVDYYGETRNFGHLFFQTLKRAHF